SIAESRPRSAEPASTFQQILRRELVGTTLARVSLEGERAAVFHFARASNSGRLLADFGAREPKLLLLAEDDRILALSSEAQLGNSRLKPGVIYAPAQSQPGTDSAPSRLRPIPGAAFPFAEAAEALYRGEDEQQRAEALRREWTRSLRKKLERLSRTRDKVRVEASRQPEAERHRRLGELISQNLHRLKRGAPVARLIEYTERGPAEVEVPLQPDRTPRQQAEWHFHQYRRLLRGSERASARLAQLQSQIDEARARMERLLTAGAEELQSEAQTARAHSPSFPRRQGPPRGRPYKEYFSSEGDRIWVGRDSKSNDELTFHLAQPGDLWLHARGASGSHVVVPLPKNVEPSSELLIDAAHLALHHSALKGEPRGEVIYVKAKHVRRRKGDPAGTAHVERERSLMVRLEPPRLARLLATRTRQQGD
ncbi:MAG TPA: NFACT RNA binding domain-containing protein, partial [Myxococcaceae bacterium]|nr:NFACT RNA binding domain-containing protein [Myxococcaceae bacterium]